MTQEKEPMVKTWSFWEKHQDDSEIYYQGKILGREARIYKRAGNTEKGIAFDRIIYRQGEDGSWEKVVYLTERTSKNGNMFLTGICDEADLIIFHKTNKRNPKAPDMEAYAKPKFKKEMKAQGDHNNIGSFPEPKAQNYNDDEMPF